MKTSISLLSVLAAALLLAACGSNGNTTSTQAASAGEATVSTATVSGAGTVLVDANGNALYSPAQEASGQIKCTGSCEQIWMPLAANGTPTASSGVTGKIGTVKRPDGTEQVTVDGAPLYTFAQDSPGQVTGDGAQDSFGGQSFTWHVVTAGGTAAPQGQTTTSSTSSSSGGYSY